MLNFRSNFYWLDIQSLVRCGEGEVISVTVYTLLGYEVDHGTNSIRQTLPVLSANPAKRYESPFSFVTVSDILTTEFSWEQFASLHTASEFMTVEYLQWKWKYKTLIDFFFMAEPYNRLV